MPEMVMKERLEPDLSLGTGHAAETLLLLLISSIRTDAGTIGSRNSFRREMVGM